MKTKAAVIVAVLIGIVAYTAFSARRSFAPAEVLPKGAVVYVEFTDLPAFLRLWEQSELKEKYLASENFNSLTQRRLGLKLASRWQEFNKAVGFPLDSETIASLADKRAAIGIYDIGNLEFVFIAPVADEIFTATEFFRNKDKFEERRLENGTKVFSADVAADRGRQPQKLLFASVRDQLVLATNEQLLLQTVGNINGAANKNRLADEPSFNSLTQNQKPNLVSVWVNQTALNNDYYFKRYWLMTDVNRLKNIRAGVFDVSIEENKIVERRKFLLVKEAPTAELDPAGTRAMLSLVPTNASFYRMRAADARTSAAAIFDCIFDRKISTGKARRNDDFSDYSFYADDDSEPGDYEYLNGKFDETVDEVPADNADESKETEDKNSQSDLRNSFQAAGSQSVLTLTEPVSLPLPLFAEFRRAAVVGTASPVNQTILENALAQAARSRVSVTAADVNLTWKTAGENGSSWRELNLPMLGWEICYAQRNGHLVVSNSSNLLKEILAQPQRMAVEDIFAAPIDDLTVVRLENKDENFGEIFGKLAGEKSDDFFLGSVGSLLETASGVKTITVENHTERNYREEKITFDLK